MSSRLPLQPGTYYHIYNRGNNREDLFVQERNYHYFLQLYAHHIGPSADTFAYCLLKNHFHVLLRASLARLPSQGFSNLFNAYARAFNCRYNCNGALFQRPFRRIPVHNEAYFTRLVTYIHRNPQHHGFVDDFRSWPYASYHGLGWTEQTHVQRALVLQWFGNERNYTQHHAHADYNTRSCLFIEDE